MKKCIALATLLTAVLALPQHSNAGGTAIPGYGSQAQPRAGAFVAKADDPSAIYHNPAGLVKMSGTVIQLGINLINFSQTFQRSGSYDDCTGAKCPVGGVPYAGQPYPKTENTSHGAVHVGDYAVVPLISVVSDLGLDLPMVFAAGVFAPSVGSADRDIDSD
ncbi:MAG: outer membrane protein transport protein, partial [Planctomycetes bacterium]|nr:outer membrane protein transport protein [Planctomycetota bacterium]